MKRCMNWNLFRRQNRITTVVSAVLFTALFIAVYPTRSAAATALWTGESSGADTWTAPSNWLANYRPMNGDDVVFGPSARTTSLDNIALLTIATLGFSTNAPAFTIHIVRTSSLTISGAGVINNSANLQTLINHDNLFDGPEAGGITIFQNDATADDLRIINRGSNYFVDGWGETVFRGTSDAGTAVIINEEQFGTGFGGRTFFEENSSAASATIVNQAGVSSTSLAGSFTLFSDNANASSATIINEAGDLRGAAEFYGDAGAGSARITNNGGAGSGDEGGFTNFSGASAESATITNGGGAVDNAAGGRTAFGGLGATAGSVVIINNGAMAAGAAGGAVEFYDEATAANATITNQGGAGVNALGGGTVFTEISSAANATLIANTGVAGGLGGQIAFYQNSTGGTARVEVFGNGFLDISGRNAPVVTVGSIEGDGLVFLGANQLTVGNNNLSTTFSGTIQDGDLYINTNDVSNMGSLKKIGTGTLSLASANSYSGGTFVNAGTLRASHDGALGAGNVNVAVNTDPGTTLILGGFQSGATNNYISDVARLHIVTDSTVHLDYSGSPDVVGFLFLNDVSQPAGLYGSAASGAPNQLRQFTGAGRILVTTPTARSRKQHGAADAHITLPFTGPVGIECRNPGVNNSFTIILTFGFPVTFANAAVTSGTGMVVSTTGNGTDFITLDLAGVTNAQRLAVTLSGVNYGTNTGDVVIRMGVLLGDTTANGTVNASDIGQTKSESGQAVDASNFRTDVTVSGSINASDIGLVKSMAGTTLP